MCGFLGVCDKSSDTEYNMKLLANLIYHRGPDCQNIESVGKTMHIAFNRLAIIDLEGGSQPMHNNDRSVTIMCNGEIYNYLELRKHLQDKQIEFNTNSDTEVVLRMYEKYGIEMVNMLEGMYAICIIDIKKKIIYLIRDRFGIKPLYYTRIQGEKYAFASEIKPLLRLPYVSRNIRRESVADFLAFEYVQAPYTIFEDIEKVCPGHYLEIKNGKIDDVEYWDCADIRENSKISIEDCKKKVVELMNASMNIHLRSDVKLGVFLSGGIDSGLITALASKKIKDLDTYTLKFEGADFDESALARLVSDKYETNHHCYTVKAEDLEKLIVEMMWYFDEPIGDSGILPNYILNKLVSENKTRVILSGAGGDELFAGYTYYFGSKVEKKVSKFPHLARVVARTIRKNYPEMAEKLIRSSYLRENPIKHQILQEHTFSDDEIMKLIDQKPVDVKEIYAQKSKGGKLNKQLYTDIKTYLADDLMLLSDRSCMAHSVEGRVPFLYSPLVEFALTIPENVKAPKGQRKWLLKEIAKDYLPEELIGAPKRGFTSPIHNWEKTGFGKFAYMILNQSKSKNRSIWNQENYVSFVSNYVNYDKYFNKIYLLLVLEIFIRVHIDNSFDDIKKIDFRSIYDK